MTVAYVRDTGKTVASSTPSNASFASLPSVNNHIITGMTCWMNNINPPVLTVSDNQSNSYTEDKKQVDGSGSGTYAAIVDSAKVVTSSGTFTVTMTSGDPSTQFTWMAVEFSGLVTASWKDQSGANSGSTGANTATVTAAGANAQANELVIAMMVLNSGAANLHIATPTSGYTELFVDNDGVNDIPGEFAYKVVSAGETSSAAWNHDSPDGWGAVIVTYKASSNPTYPQLEHATMRGSFRGQMLGVR